MTPWSLLPLWVKILVIAAVLAATAAAVHTYNEALREEGRQEIRAERAAEKIAQQAADAKETQRRLDRQGVAQRENAQELARYSRAAADAVAARADMQQLLADLEAVAQLGSRDSATTDERKAGAAATGVLAELSGRADALAEVYARTADTARRAGTLCERYNDALMPAPP